MKYVQISLGDYLIVPNNMLNYLYEIIHTCHTRSIKNIIISPGEVFQKHTKKYSIYIIKLDLLAVNDYVKLQGHKEQHTTFIQTSYEYYSAYTLELI